MKKLILLLLISIMALVSSCSDVIQVDLPTGSTLLVVDAFINNKKDTQVVRLTATAPYFSNTHTPGVAGATVVLNDLTNNHSYTFSGDGLGNYRYYPGESNFDSMALVNHNYQLNVSYNGTNYTAFSKLNRTTHIKRILWFHSKRLNNTSSVKHQDTTHWFPYLIASDTAGATDYYWIRTYKNGIFYGTPRDMNIVQDAGGVGTDGLQFIPPVAFFTPVPGSDPLYYLDVCTIEIHSLNPETFYFLTQLKAQLINSQNGLFALTPQNVKTNIKVVSGPGMSAIGWFNMAAVGTMSAIAR